MNSAPVLIVEDDDDLRELMACVVEEAGFPVTTASNGQVALDRVKGDQPAVILLDMRMPVLDGWGFARAYKDMPGPHAPIVVVTAAQNASNWADQVGAAAHLAKPFDLQDLVGLVQHQASAARQA
jgi:CheY-like chemotaxis protein